MNNGLYLQLQYKDHNHNYYIEVRFPALVLEHAPLFETDLNFSICLVHIYIKSYTNQIPYGNTSCTQTIHVLSYPSLRLLPGWYTYPHVDLFLFLWLQNHCFAGNIAQACSPLKPLCAVWMDAWSCVRQLVQSMYQMSRPLPPQLCHSRYHMQAAAGSSKVALV